jgi:hypothetical protein
MEQASEGLFALKSRLQRMSAQMKLKQAGSVHKKS